MVTKTSKTHDDYRIRIVSNKIEFSHIAVVFWLGRPVHNTATYPNPSLANSAAEWWISRHVSASAAQA